MKLEGKGILMKVFQDLIRLTPAPTIGREAAVFFLTMAVLVICVYLAIDSANRTLVLILVVRLPSFSGHPINADLVSVREDVHCESTTPEIHT